MIFSSIEFLLYFLPIFLLTYTITPQKLKNVTLLLGSLVFYAYGEPRFLILLLASVATNFFLGLHIGEGKQNRKRTVFFITAITFNVAVLLFFKANVKETQLPLGISFYTFQMMSYLIDVYRGETLRERSLLSFADYVMMFPQLVSGPIVRYEEVRNELHSRKPSADEIQDGLGKFIVGLSYKVLLADRIGLLWHEVQVIGFESISTPLAWMGAIAYSLMIYFDFYGYSLMAIGLGLMMGFHLPENFNTPYMARSVRDFYRRWHITLGRWFCRYIYIPLGGNRKGEWRTICNLAAVWLLTGIWHGNSLNYLLWAGMLLLCIIVERQIEKIPFVKYLSIFPHLYLWVVIPISWMCFANTDIAHLEMYLSRMFSVGGMFPARGQDWMKALETYGVLLGISAVCATGIVRKCYESGKNKFIVKVVLAVLFWVCVNRLIAAGNNPFMYFSY